MRVPFVLPAAIAFLLSGASALIYQVSWQRILFLQTGVGVASVSLIVAAFMAGLGLGSYLGGRMSERLSPVHAARRFAAVEALIALFGLSSVFLYHDVLSLRLGWLFAEPVRGGIVQMLALLPPTTLMGMSLPLLVRSVVRDASRAARDIALLYGLNTLGAAAGALLTPWVLIRNLGLEGSVTRAAVLNLAAGAIVWFAARRTSATATEPSPDDAGAAPLSSPRRPPSLWIWIYGLSGFVALSLEIVWFRIFDVAARGTSYTFGTVLAVYLLGSGLGAFVAASHAKKLRQPLLAFLLLQCALLAYSGLALGFLGRGALTWAPLEFMNDYWRSTHGFDLGGGNWAEALKLYGLVPAFLFGLPTLLMGFSFAVLHRAVQDDPATSGSKAGILQAANILGCVLGSLITGLVFLQTLGSADTLRLLVIAGLAFLFTAIRHYPKDPRPRVALLLLGGAAIATPRSEDLWRRLHGAEAMPAVIREDASAVTAVVQRGPDFFRVFVNGHSHSWMPYGEIHSLLGLIPAVVHDAPTDVAIVGLGSADTAWAAAANPKTRSLTVFEIARPQPDVLRGTIERSNHAALDPLRRFLADPRVRIRLADGRVSLLHEQARYDLIEADPLLPTMAGSGNLFSLEFFELVRSRLKPGGIATVWAPTGRVRRTFRAAFPHVLEFPDGILIGSSEPLRIRTPEWRAVLESPEVRAYLGIPQLVQRARWSLRQVTALGPDNDLRPLNHDLFPRDEFRTPDQ